MRRWSLAAVTFCAGCASIHSTPIPHEQAVAEGLVYHLPRRDVVVRVTVVDKPASNDTARATGAAESSGVTDITVERGPAYADISQRFALGFERSAFADHSIDIGISVDGLLTKSNATYSATLAAALESVANGAAASRSQASDSQPCTAAGVHVFVLPVPPRTTSCEAALDITQMICGKAIKVRVQEQAPSAPPGASVQACSAAQGYGDQARVGVFYRQSQPYTVTVTPVSAGWNLVQTVLLPSRSPTRFLPMDRALFADTSAEVGFEHGEPKTLKQSANGEGSEMLKLPAKVAKAYFAAVGAVLTGISGRDGQRADAAAAQARALAAQQQLALCRAAASAKPADPALVEAACRIDAGQ